MPQLLLAGTCEGAHNQILPVHHKWNDKPSVSCSGAAISHQVRILSVSHQIRLNPGSTDKELRDICIHSWWQALVKVRSQQGNMGHCNLVHALLSCASVITLNT